MIAIIYIALLVLASAASFIAISRRVDARLGGGIATVLWAVLVPASFNITRYHGTASTTESSQALAFLTVTLFIVMLVFTFAAATSRLPSKDQTRFGSEGAR